MNLFQITVWMLQKPFGSAEKSQAAGRRRSGDDSACLLYCQAIARCKPEAAGALLTAVPNIRGAKEIERRDRQIEGESLGQSCSVSQ